MDQLAERYRSISLVWYGWFIVGQDWRKHTAWREGVGGSGVNGNYRRDASMFMIHLDFR